MAIQLSPDQLRRANMQARLDALEQQVDALQRHRFAVSVFLGLSFRKRFLWLLFGLTRRITFSPSHFTLRTSHIERAKVFRPSKRDAKPEVTP